MLSTISVTRSKPSGLDWTDDLIKAGMFSGGDLRGSPAGRCESTKSIDGRMITNESVVFRIYR
jgi:hypothetical protein